MSKKRAVYTIVLSIFVWVSVTGCAAVVGGVEKTESTASGPAIRSVEDTQLDLSGRYWDPLKRKRYRIDKATGKRLYGNHDKKEKRWYIVDSTTKERVYLPK